MKFFFSLLSIALLVLVPCTLFANQSKYDVRYWDWGNTPVRDNYQYDLLKLVLERTRSNYGDYSLKRMTAFFTTARVRRELSRGKVFNVQAAPWRPITDDSLEPVLRVDIDICKGLIGYRRLIVKAEDWDLFSRISQLSELRGHSVGVGRGWVDADIFIENGFKVNSAANFETLLPMLVARRFDFISLSVIEADEAIKKTGLGESLKTIDGPLLYMPLPFVFYVSVNDPLLAERITEGLNLAMADGSFDLLFKSHFGPYIQYIRQYKEKFLILKNSGLPASMQTKPILLE